MPFRHDINDSILAFAVGQPLPPSFRSGGISLHEDIGLIAVLVAFRPDPAEIEAVRSGPLSIGMLPGGMHATIIQFRCTFSEPPADHDGSDCLVMECAWGMGGPARKGDYPAAALEDDLLVTVLLANENAVTLAMRVFTLSREDLAFFRADVQRQAKVRKIWSQEAQDRSFLREASRHGDEIPRSACHVVIEIPGVRPTTES